MKRTELLCPAGKWDSLRAAVQNGADAVYLGEKSFSARKSAANFTWEEINEAVKYCHLRDVKVHLALNTLISDAELSFFEKSVVNAANAGVDALIIQDLGAAHIARSVCPDMPLHASTQLTASNLYDVLALQELGFSRIVLSRELSRNEIEHIHKNTDVELEAFIHGALCISFSGKCLMSSFIGGRSGNRGMCAQPCRQSYMYNSNKGYFLSPRDLCLADNLKEMHTAGITSFKIEGRMKSPEYVATVTSVYRKYLDSFLPLEKEDEDKLKKIFVRGDGFTKAYFAEKNTPEIMNYTISNDNISSRADEDILKEAQSSYLGSAENKKIPVDAHLILKKGAPSSLTLTDGKNSVSVLGEIPQVAVNSPILPQRVKAQISKLGSTPFVLENYSSVMDNDITIPISSLNALRRDAAECLSKERTAVLKKETFKYEYSKKLQNRQSKNQYILAEVTTTEQFYAAKDADRVLVPLSLWDKITPDKRCFIVLPQVVLDEKEVIEKLSKISSFYGVYVSSLGMAKLASELKRKVYADWGMNIYNLSASILASSYCSSLTLSPELSLSSASDISASLNLDCEILCYGYQRVMVSRACLIRGITGKCDCQNPISIKDKTGAYFKILGDSNSHLNTVLNSCPTFTADKLNKLKNSSISGLRLYFSTESGEETSRIINMYHGKGPLIKPPVYTRGYLFK